MLINKYKASLFGAFFTVGLFGICWLFWPPSSCSCIDVISSRELSYYTDKAENGDAEAALKVSDYYTYSNYSKPDSQEKKLYYLELAAKLGHPTALYKLAYYYGNTVSDPEKALYQHKENKR